MIHIYLPDQNLTIHILDGADPSIEINTFEIKHVLNHSRRICYSLEETKILYLDHTESDFADPLPILLGYGRSCDPGMWIGDIIGVSEEIPEGYTLLEKIYLDW